LRILYARKCRKEYELWWRGVTGSRIQSAKKWKGGKWAVCEATKEKLGFKGKGRKVVGEIGSYQLRESPASYNVIIGHENTVLRPQNEVFLKEYK
jgi:hypothetical protein